MVASNNRNVLLGSTLVVLLVLVVGYWSLNRGYGEVSPVTYEFSKALYSACLKKSDEHLGKIEDMLDDAGEEAPPMKERKWLKQIIDRARKGQWDRHHHGQRFEVTAELETKNRKHTQHADEHRPHH